MAKSYFEKLRDPRWQKLRLEVMDRDGFKCCNCSENQQPLNVHHRGYIKNYEPWDYDHSQLITLCEECHRDIHEEQELFKQVLSRLPIGCEHYVSHDDLAFILSGLFGIKIDPRHSYDEMMIRLGDDLGQRILHGDPQ